MKGGGEDSLGYYYFKLFRSRGIDTGAVCHARVREEILASLTENEAKRFHFVEDSLLQALLWRISGLLSPRIRDLLLAQLIHAMTMRRARRIVKRQLHFCCPRWIAKPGNGRHTFRC